jgi:hypothetical protein
VSNKKEQSNSNEAKPRHYSSLGVKEILYSGAAAAASLFIAAGAAIRKEFNEELPKWAGMRDFEVPADAADHFRKKGFTPKEDFTSDNIVMPDAHGNVTFKGLTDAHAQHLLQNDIHSLREPRDWKANAESTRHLKREFSNKRADLLLDKYGIHSKGIKGVLLGSYQRWCNLGKSDRWAVAFAGTSAAAIVGIGTYNLLTSIATRKKAREIEDILLDKALLKTNTPEMLVIEHKEGEPTVKVSHVSRESTVAADQAPTLATSR